jgi:hypothetical protein
MVKQWLSSMMTRVALLDNEYTVRFNSTVSYHAVTESVTTWEGAWY